MAGKTTNKYKKENYDTIIFPMAKGNRDIIKEHCQSIKESYHSFLRRAVFNTLHQDRIQMLKRNTPDIPIRRDHPWLIKKGAIKDCKLLTYDEWCNYVTHS